MFPAWLAAIEQVPGERTVTVFPETVQTGSVFDAKLTASPDVTVALTVIGGLPNTLFERGPKVMVWLAGVTLKFTTTGVAAI